MKIFWINLTHKKGGKINHIVLFSDSEIQGKNAFTSLANAVGGSTSHGSESTKYNPIGGANHKDVLKLGDVESFIVSSSIDHIKYKSFEYVDHLEISKCKEQYEHAQSIICNIPLHLLVPKLSVRNLRSIGKQHNLFIHYHTTKQKIMELFKTHSHDCGHQYVTVLSPYTKASKSGQSKQIAEKIGNAEKQKVKSDTVTSPYL
jgi:hypothetical protein